MSRSKIFKRHFLHNKEIGSIIVATEYLNKEGVTFEEYLGKNKPIEKYYRDDQTCEDNLYIWNGWKRIKEVI